MFDGLAKDADEAAGNMSESVAKIGEEAAEKEEAALGRTLDDDGNSAKRFAGLKDNPGAENTGKPASTGGFTGAGHVEKSTPEAEAAYARIRANTGDVPKIAGNTGISEDLIGQVKNHLFMTEHDVPLGPNKIGHGYFTADDDIADLWSKAEDGSLNPSEQQRFRSLMSHEYVESRLMESGMPYRSADPESWENGEIIFNPQHFGAHEVAPTSGAGTMRQWRALGLTPPDAPLAADLSNIDDVVAAARRGLNL